LFGVAERSATPFFIFDKAETAAAISFCHTPRIYKKFAKGKDPLQNGLTTSVEMYEAPSVMSNLF
jgi:hypothetical protein